ncbi:glutaredoxin [Halobacteriales archaeon SW_7_68_16]|nr:MAG: glutaredoxin [Halobacteriales archaeon SW_7_68_16]
MSFRTEGRLDREAVQERVNEAIAGDEVVLFMKGNELMPQCGYSERALRLVARHRDEYATVDVLESLREYRDALETHSGWRTVPQTYVDGEFVGGTDVLSELDDDGELAGTLAAD